MIEIRPATDFLDESDHRRIGEVPIPHEKIESPLKSYPSKS
jgi:hypothetical protein